MFEKRTKEYIQEDAPTTVIPRCMPLTQAREKYGQVYKLASNENPFGVSPKAKEALMAAVPSCYLYSDNSRETILRAKLAQKFNCTPENIYISSGAANVLKDICEVFICPGDECIISNPSYPPYYNWVFRNGGVIVDIPCKKDDQTMDIAAIKAAITDRTKILLLCNPNNPTSTAVPREAMLDILSVLPKGAILVADEAYVDFADDPENLTLVPYIFEFPNIVVVRTFSKVYGMASARMGYSVACKEITDYLFKAMAARDLNVFGVDGAIAALDDEEFRLKTVENNAVERAYMIREITALGYKVYASQSNFLWVDFGRPAADVHDDLLPYGIIIRGDFKFARISVGLHIENETLIRALKDLKEKRH